jgi:hypothetical protein
LLVIRCRLPVIRSSTLRLLKVFREEANDAERWRWVLSGHGYDAMILC